MEKFKYNLQNIQETTRFRYWFTGRLNIGPDIWSYETVSDKGKIPTRRNSRNCRKTEKPSLKLMFLHIFEIFPEIVSENKNDVQKSDHWHGQVFFPWCGCWWPQVCQRDYFPLLKQQHCHRVLFHLGEKTDTSKLVHLGFQILSCSSNLVEIPLKLPACAIWPEFPLKSSFISLFSSALKLIISQQWTLL